MDILKLRNSHNRDKNIIFYDIGHKYDILTDINSKYTSVTTWIHSHFKKFDSDKAIACMMKGKKWCEGHKYWGLSHDEIKKLWSENGKRESKKGTDLHYNIECFMNNSTLKYDYSHNDLYDYYLRHEPTSYDLCKEWQYFLNFIRDNQSFIPYRTEWMVYDSEYKLAGSIDMIYKNEDGTLNIYDWKRCKEISAVNKWNDFSITDCISELPNTNYWHYSLQLNLYKRILEKNYNVIVRDLYLVRLHPDNEDNNYMLIKAADLSSHVSRLLEKIT